MNKINLFSADITVIEEFINKLIYLYHLYTKDKIRPYSNFISYLKNGWDFKDEFKNNDVKVKEMRDEIIDHYKCDFDDENFSELIKTSLYEYITNYYCYFNKDINIVKDIFLNKNYNNISATSNICNILLDYNFYIKNIINIFLVSTYDFKNILSNSITNNKKNEVSNSIKNLIINKDKNFEFYISLRIFIETIEKLNVKETKQELEEVEKKKRTISLENFFKNDEFYHFNKVLSKTHNREKNIEFFSKQTMDILNSHAHIPTNKKKCKWKESSHNYYLDNEEDLWSTNHTFIYDVFKLFFNSNFLNLLDSVSISQIYNLLTKKIRKNYHKTFCNYFEYILYLLIINVSDVDDNLYKIEDANIDDRFKDYNNFFNILDLNEFYLLNNSKKIFQNLYKKIFYFPNCDYERKTNFILNELNKLKLSVFNKKLVTIEDILNEIEKIQFYHNCSISYDINFEKIYIFLTIGDYKEILNLKVKGSKDLTLFTYLDFYNFINIIKINPIRFVIFFLKSNDLIFENHNELDNLANNINALYNNHYSIDNNEKFNTIYENRILLNNVVNQNLRKIREKMTKKT